jgi:small GTP-binding protein
MEEDIDFLLKFVIIGDSGVGKTNLISRFTSDHFEENTTNTIGVDFSAKDLKIDNKWIKVQFWDTAGQEKYKALASSYYKNALGAFIVYDITRRETFDKVGSWIDELKKYCDQDIDIMLLGNKSDLENKRQVNKEEAKKFSESKGLFFMEISAKKNEDSCVIKAFNLLIERVYKKNLKNLEGSKTENELISLGTKNHDLLNKQNKKDEQCC